jgi:hypothetical protein
MKIYKKYEIWKKVKKELTIKRVEVNPHEVIKKYIGNSCYIESQVEKLSELVTMMLTLPREEVFEKIIRDFDSDNNYDFIDGNAVDYKWEVVKE